MSNEIRVISGGVVKLEPQIGVAGEVAIQKQRLERNNARRFARQNAAYKYRKRPIAVLGTFEADETWTRISGVDETDVVADTTNFKSGTQGLKIKSQSGTTTYAERTGLTLDLSTADYLQLDLYAAAPNNLATVCLLVYTDETSYFVSYVPLTALQSKPLRDGWCRCKIPLGAFGTDGTPSWATITRVLIQVNSTAGTTASVTIDNFLAMPSGAVRGKVILRFDDAVESISLAKPVFDKYHLPGVLGVISSKVGTAGYADLATIRAFEEAGWEIANHTTSVDPLDEASVATILSAIDGASEWMREQGLTDPGYVIIPGHETSALLQETIRDFTVLACAGRDGIDMLPPEDWHLMQFKNGSNQTAATIQGYIDAAEADKGLATILFHDVDAAGGTYAVTPTVLDAVLAYILTKDVDVVTYTDVLGGQ